MNETELLQEGYQTNKIELLQKGYQYPVEERFIVSGDDHLIRKLEEMELIIFYDGVWWLTYEGEAYARGDLC